MLSNSHNFEISLSCALLATVKQNRMKRFVTSILVVSQSRSLVDGSKSSQSRLRKSKKGDGKKMGSGTGMLKDISTNDDDFGEPAWLDIIGLAFPPWDLNGPCGSVTAVGGSDTDVPMPSQTGGGGKWNPCCYTKRFAGLDPAYGG